MRPFPRVFALALASCFAQCALAQEAKPPAPKPLGFFDKVELITQTWWFTTVIACTLLGLLVGYFIYRSAVANGRAGGATGAGCLAAVLVFLGAQVLAIVVLVSTVFAAPTNSNQNPNNSTSSSGTGTTASPANPQNQSNQSRTDLGSSTSGQTSTGQPPKTDSPKAPSKPATTGGDDF